MRPMPKQKIVITYPLPGDPLQYLKQQQSTEIWMQSDRSVLPRPQLKRRVAGASGLVVTPSDGPINGEIFNSAGPELRVVSCYSVGFDYVDIVSATERGIAVGITPDATTEPTADVAWLLILGVNRNLTRATQLIRNKQWRGITPGDQYGHRLFGKKLFIVGAGRIGTAVARRALGWNMDILYTARSAKPGLEAAPYHGKRVSLDQGLCEADVVSLHVPLNEATHHLIGHQQLRQMKTNSIIVNTSRGGVIDERALAQALVEGDIRGAGLDVYENEPEITSALHSADNCLMLPHIGTATIEDREWMTKMAMVNLLAGIMSQPLPHPVVPC